VNNLLGNRLHLGRTITRSALCFALHYRERSDWSQL